MSPTRGIHGRRLWITCVAAALLLLCAATAAFGHVERPSYFPDPAPDTSVKPAAGGQVPKTRSLYSALKRRPPGRTRVVCQRGSLKRAIRSARRARRNGGIMLRPSDVRKFSAKQARRLVKFNRKLAKRCRYREIQKAVNASRNNDRVVVMPGVYLEPTARAKPTNDKSCDRYKTNGDRPGQDGEALSYAYQVNCPNDQNLIAVLGRAVGSGADPIPPRENRHGIPNLGRCIRCNFQIEGSGPVPDDVIIEAGDRSRGDRGPSGVGAKKDVGIRADRADGFVLRNIMVRHAKEHGIYVHEVDGYKLDRFKAYYNFLYGTLTFTSDHGVQQNCDAVGHGDSGIYPGGAPETGAQRPSGTPNRLNQKVTRCDLRHNMAGYSGTNGNAVHVVDNDIYGNALGVQTDVVTGAGHPGYPGDSAVFEKNRIHSNNFNVYAPNSDVKPAFPFPVGTGLWIAGGNEHQVRGNHFYNNWRRGTMLFAVPDSLVCGPAAGGNEQAGCKSGEFSTSHFNSFYDNKMGVTPSGRTDPNGVDFWWDDFAGNRGNCWYRNTGPEPIRTDPPGRLSDCSGGSNRSTSIGIGNPENEGELISCVAAFETRNFDPNGPCPWISTPAEPQPGRSSGPGGGSPIPLPGLPRYSYSPPATRAGDGNPSQQKPVPLGVTTCSDWNAAGEAGQDALAARVRAFAGGVVNDGSQDIGSGAVLSDADAHRLFDASCSRQYAEAFLLYKLYTHAAAFSRRK
jgi:hypothetical protein